MRPTCWTTLVSPPALRVVTASWPPRATLWRRWVSGSNRRRLAITVRRHGCSRDQRQPKRFFLRWNQPDCQRMMVDRSCMFQLTLSGANRFARTTTFRDEQERCERPISDPLLPIQFVTRKRQDPSVAAVRSLTQDGLKWSKAAVSFAAALTQCPKRMANACFGYLQQGSHRSKPDPRRKTGLAQDCRAQHMRGRHTS